MASKVHKTTLLNSTKCSRPGIHAKTKNSNNKQSKHYKKNYRGQGK